MGEARRRQQAQGLTRDQFLAKSRDKDIGQFLDRTFNAGRQKYGFALLSFPYGEPNPQINVLSNIGHRETLQSLFAAMNAQFTPADQPKTSDALTEPFDVPEDAPAAEASQGQEPPACSA